MMCNLDLDPPSIWSERKRKAIKPHRCSECGGIIARGETYTYQSGRWDGHFDAFKRCAACDVPARWMLEYCKGYELGRLRGDLLDDLGNFGRFGKRRMIHGDRIADLGRATDIARMIRGMTRREKAAQVAIDAR